MKKHLVSTLLVVLIALPLAASPEKESTGTPWLNISVQAEEDHADIQVHLPMNMVLAVINSVEIEGFEDGKIELDSAEAEIDWPKLLDAVRKGPAGRYVTVSSDEADVSISKTATNLLINVQQKEDEKARIRVTLPLALLDAVVIDEDNRIDIEKLLAGLSELPGGDLVTVDSSEAKVRVWVE